MAGTKLGLVGPSDSEPVVNEEVSFDAKSNEFLVNNNVLSNYQHTKHISTTEPLYLDGMAGSDNLVHKPKRSGSQKVAAFGDYLLSDLKTIIAQADLKDDQKDDVVGICIGQNPVSGKNVFWNVDSMTNTDTYQFYTSAKFDATKFTTLSKDGNKEPLENDGQVIGYVSKDAFGGEQGYIMATSPMSIEDPGSNETIFHYGEFGGLQNTIEWYKQASAAGISFSAMPALNTIMQLSGVESMDDNYNLWFLGSMGHIILLCGENNPFQLTSEESVEKYNALSEAVSKLGKTFMDGDFWSSSFFLQLSDDSLVHGLQFNPYVQGWNGYVVNDGYRLFALIEVPGASVEQGTDPGKDVK